MFSERIKNLRAEHKLTQQELADMLGISRRNIQSYESGTYPRDPTLYNLIGKTFNVDPASLIADEDYHAMDADEKGGSKSRRDVQALLSEVGGLFAGGDLSDEDKDKVMKVITDLYWRSKEKNKKYTPKKYRTEKKEGT